MLLPLLLFAPAVLGVDLSLIDSDISDRLGAKCLDGSRPGIYAELNSSSTEWSFFLQGGGWCYTLQECRERALTRLGSSKYFKASFGMGKGSPVPTLSSDAAENPRMHSWNRVYVNYCDGASYSGARDSPVDGLHFRGAAVLRSVFEHLERHGNLARASRVLYSGCSAGGLGVVVTADRFRAWLPQARMTALPGSGFFLLDHTYAGKDVYGARMRNVFSMQNCSSGVNQRCIAGTPEAQQWQCLSSPRTLPFLQTPAFFANSVYDSWQMSNVFEIPCHATGPNGCSAQEIEAVNDVWRPSFMRQIQPALEPSSPHAAFLYSCWRHCFTSQGNLRWKELSIGNVTLYDAFTAWDSKVGCVLSGPKPCNPQCQKIRR